MSTPPDTAPPGGPPPGSATERRELELGPIPGFTRPPRGRAWYRRWWLAILVVVGLVAAAVISDLPTPQTTAQQATTVAGVVREITTGVHPCVFAVDEAFKTFYEPSTEGKLTKVSRGFAHQYLDEDQQACSFESTSIFSMSTITVPSSPAGNRLTAIIKTVLEWATSDANGAIVDIQTLLKHPTNAPALKDLAKRERMLASDRGKAERDLREAKADLDGQPLPGLGLPSLPTPASPSSPSA